MVLIANKSVWIRGGLALALVLGAAWWYLSGNTQPEAVTSSGKPALTVATVTLKQAQWMQNLSANGSVVAWQEAVIGAEVIGVRIAEVRVNVGDQVKKGQLLARLATDTMQAGEAESQAMLKESEAQLGSAVALTARTRKLADAGFVSPQQLEQAVHSEHAAKARVDAQRARHQSSALRLSNQHIVAPDSGVISSRSATVGTLTQPGMELFRLIRQGRLEWHADLTAEELGLIRKGMSVELISAQGKSVHGVVSALAPSINPQTRYARVLVALPENAGMIAGMFARGSFQLGEQAMPVAVLPQSAVVLKDGAAFVFVVDANSHVSERKVSVGRRHGEQIEITDGLAEGVAVVESGGAFLVDGDRVRLAGSIPLPNPDETTGHSTKASKDDAKVAGHLSQAGEGANEGPR